MTNQTKSELATFVARERCIACESGDLTVLDSGKFSEDPVRTFIDQDPWGESPLPALGDHVWEYTRCNQCGQAFQKWLLTPDWQEIRFRDWMSEEAIREFEREHALDQPEARYFKGIELVKHALRLEKMTHALRGRSALRVLDFGCGWGEFLVMSKLLGFEAYGIERAPDRQRSLLNQGVVAFPDLEVALQTVAQGFHAATLFQVLEHLEEPLKVLESLRDVLVPGAVLILEVPDCTGATGIRSKADYYNLHPLEHINCFTGESLRKLAERAGFRAETPATAHVTTDPVKVLRGEAKRVVQKTRPPGTNQYFRRV